MNAGLCFHHIGCLTENIEISIANYVKDFGFNLPNQIFTITNQQVKVCFIEIGPNSFIEFVEPMGDNPSLKKILKSKNPYYHIGYLTSDITNSINDLISCGYFLVNRFHSEAFNNKECAFLYSTEMHLIELIER
jgi:methylmalonyl-CoA/ethylmalonyl-CoA epimerase